MDDHDQRFKITIKEFFAEWLTEFHPAWAARFELSRVEWQEQELFSDPPLGNKQTQKQQLQETLNKDAYREVRAVNKTWFEEGVEKGRKEIIQHVLEERFGSLPDSVLQRLNSWPDKELLQLGRKVISAQSLKDLGLAE